MFYENTLLKSPFLFLKDIAAEVVQKSKVVVVRDNCLQQQQKLIKLADLEDSEECDDDSDHSLACIHAYMYLSVLTKML